MSENNKNSNVKWPALNIIIIILIAVIGGVVAWVKSDLNKINDKLEAITEMKVGVAEMKKDIADIIKQINDEKKKSGGSSFDSLMRILGYK